MKSPALFLALLIALAAGALVYRASPLGPGAILAPSPAQATLPDSANSVAPATADIPVVDSLPPSSPEPAVPVTGIFGDKGPVALADIPAGPFRDSLEALSVADQATALAELVRVRAPRAQLVTLRATPSGALIHLCPPDPHPDHPGHDHDTGSVSESDPDLAHLEGPSFAPVPIASPPERSSRPNSTRVLYLDFNGMTVRNTAWNDYLATSVFHALPYDIDGNPTTFSDAEQKIIINVWKRVAEDFAPFDINVTTVEPTTFTATTGRVLITHERDANYNYVPGGQNNGGIAYLGVFNQSDYVSRFSPAWVIVDNMTASDPADLAEVTSHEFGHNLGLNHDGTLPDNTYYWGHGSGALSWAPIMGASYNRSVTTFSKGEYYNANNTSQDDLADIAAHLPYRADAVPATLAGAVALGDFGTATDGLIERNTDVDTFKLFNAGGRIQLIITTFTSDTSTRGNNLDLQAEVLNASGAVVDTYAPSSGPDVTINLSAPAGLYYLRVSSSGAGSPYSSSPSGYTAYGSIGSYSIFNQTSSAPPPEIFLHPASIALPLGSSHTFSVGATDPSGLSLHYQWRLNGIPIDGATAPSLTLASISFTRAGSYTCQVANSAGTSALSTAAALVAYRATPQTYVSNASISVTLPRVVVGEIESYHWARDGQILTPGDDPRWVFTGPNLTIRDAQFTDNGVYTFVPVFNGQPLPVGAITLAVRPPVVLSIPDIVTVERGASLLLPITSSHDDLTYRLVGLPSGIGYVPSTLEIYSGTPGAVPGAYPIRLIGTDPFGNRDAIDFTLRVENRELTVGVPSTVPAYVGTDPVVPVGDVGDTLTPVYRYTNLPDGIGANLTTGTLFSRTPPAAPGEYLVTLTITDAYGNASATTFTLVVSPLPASDAPSYAGLVERHTELNLNQGGTFTLTPVLAKGAPTGAYTGSLILGPIRFVVAGRLVHAAPDSPRLITATATAKGLPSLSVTLSVPADGSSADGAISFSGNELVTLSAWPTPYSKKNPATPFVGKHVFALFPPEDAAPDAPAGTGLGTLAITAAGKASWTVRLADGTPLTGSTSLGRDGHVPLFSRIAKPGGSLLGPLSLSSADRSLDGSLSWLRSPAPAKTYASTALYRDGFGPLSLTVLGGPLSPPPAGTRVLGLPDSSPNARLSFLGAGLSDEHLSQLALPPLTVTTKNTVSRPTSAAANPAALSLSLKPGSASFNGSFVLKDPNPLKPGASVSRKVSYQGVLLDGRGVGFFLLPGLKTNSAETPPTLSGSVLLEPDAASE